MQAQLTLTNPSVGTSPPPKGGAEADEFLSRPVAGGNGRDRTGKENKRGASPKPVRDSAITRQAQSFPEQPPLQHPTPPAPLPHLTGHYQARARCQCGSVALVAGLGWFWTHTACKEAQHG